jgi:hypothetical protein
LAEPVVHRGEVVAQLVDVSDIAVALGRLTDLRERMLANAVRTRGLAEKGRAALRKSGRRQSAP